MHALRDNNNQLVRIKSPRNRHATLCQSCVGRDGGDMYVVQLKVHMELADYYQVTITLDFIQFMNQFYLFWIISNTLNLHVYYTIMYKK